MSDYTFDPPVNSQYLRLVFTCYWTDSCPSAEVFYVPGTALELSYNDVFALEAEVLAIMQDWDGMRATEIIFNGLHSVHMTPEDVTAANWYVFDPESVAPEQDY